MKKLVAILIVIPLYALCTYGIGLSVQREVDALADQSQARMPALHLVASSRRGTLFSEEDLSYRLGPRISINRHFHRGWFSSSDEATVQLPDPGAGTGSVQFSLHTIIHHGPFCGPTVFALACTETHMRAGGPLQAALVKVFADKEPLTIRSRFAFFGGGSAVVTSPAVAHAVTGHGATLSWGGLDATVHYGAKQDWYDIVADAPSFHFENDKGAVGVERMRFGGNARRALGSLYQGESHLELDRLSVHDHDNTRGLTADALALNSASHAQNGYLDGNYRMAVGSISAPPLNLTGANFDFSFKHLGLAALDSLVVTLRQANQAQDPGTAPAVRGMNILAAIRQPLQALVLDAPEIDVDRLNLTGAQGQTLITGALHFTGVAPADFDAPMLLLQKLEVRIDVAIDEAFLRGLPGDPDHALSQFQPMIDQGYVTRDAGALRTQLLLHGGRPTLNGKPFNPSLLRPSPRPATPPTMR